MKRFIFIFLIFPLFTIGQDSSAELNRTIDSLKLALKYAKHDTTKLILRTSIGEATSNFRIGFWDSLYRDSKKLNYALIETAALNNIGYLYNNEGNIPKALEYYHKSLQIQEEAGDKSGIALLLNNIGGIYKEQGDIPKALEYWNKSLKIKEEIGDKEGISNSLNNIGVIFEEQGNISKAMEYYQRGLKINEDIGNKEGISYSLSNIGLIYGNQGDYHKAVECYQKSLNIYEETGDKSGMAFGLNCIANLFIKKGNLTEALLSAQKGMALAREVEFPLDIKNSANTLKRIFQKQNKFKEAIEMYMLEVKMKDSIKNEETQKAAIKKQMQYDYETKARELKNAQDKKDIITKEELKQREKERNYFIVGSGLMIILALFIFKGYRQKQKDNVLINKQKLEVEESRKEIIDSINYAKRIQKAHLPSEAYITKTFNRLKNIS